jgi:hypothetical protein
VNSQKICLICHSETEHFSTFTIRDDISGNYRVCKSCKFIFAENPNWLEGSFTDVLNSLDIGSLDRCTIVADFVEVLLKSLGVDKPKVLDWGGGYGLLTRLLRDRGVDCAHYDPFIEPLFAKNIDISAGDQFDLVIMSEVMLHMTDPLDTLSELLKISKRVMFTAVIAPSDVTPEWWYFMPDTGQHITIFSEPSISEIGVALEASVLSDKRFFHLVSKSHPKFTTRLLFTKRFIPFGFSACFYFLRQLKRAIGKNQSLLQEDQEELMSNLPWKRKPL